MSTCPLLKMAALYVFVCGIILVYGSVSVAGDTCLGASTTHEVYTTTDAAASLTDSVFLVEFTLKCKNNAKNLFLNADVRGRQLPVARSGDNKYQVSWTEEHKLAPAGHYEIKFYDEEGFSALRKAQRAGDDATKVKALFTISFHHKGVSEGPIISTEAIASVLGVLLYYCAYRAKCRIQS